MNYRPRPNIVEATRNYIHVRFRDPTEFDTLRTPDWAEDAADAVVTGADVRTGKHPEVDEWAVQSVLVPASMGTTSAKSIAARIAKKIES